MSQYETTTLTPGEQQTKLTTEESYDNIDPSSPNYQGSQSKKTSMLGKLKDKTKKAGSRIKSKVGKKKNGDVDTTTTGGDEDDEEEEEEDDSPSPSPAVHATPYTGPASVPREFGTYPSQGKSNLGESESKETGGPDLSGLSLDDKSEQQPSATEKASEGAKDAMYGGAAATAGGLGYDAMSRDDRSGEKPVSEKASDVSSDAGAKAEELGRGGYNRAGEAKDTVAEKGSEVADQTKGAAYETKDAAQSKAADVNNATDDSQTYTEKATNAAVAAKDTVAEKLGVNQQQPSEGPSMVDKAKGYFGSTADTTKDKTDTSKNYAGSAYDNTASAAQGATDTTKDYATRAKDTVADAATPKDEHKALSEKVTETLGGLTTPANTPKTAPGDEANPGILGKLTGMLGYPQKGPDSGVTPSDTVTPKPTTQ